MLGEEAVQLRADRTAAFRWVEVAEFGLLRRLAAAGIHVLYRPSRDRTGPKTVNTAGPGGGLTYATPSPGNAHTTAPHEFASRLSQQRVARTSPPPGAKSQRPWASWRQRPRTVYHHERAALADRGAFPCCTGPACARDPPFCP